MYPWYTPYMKFKTIQWNIGGGKQLSDGADPTLLSSYREDGLDKIIEFIRQQDADIITLQETHAADGHSQPERIAKALGYLGWANDEWADSHIEAGQRLGQGIVSRLPLQSHDFEWFTNPNFEAIWEDGSIARSHDKGRTRCEVMLSDEAHITVQTLHTVPFRRYKIEITSAKAKAVIADMSAKLSSDDVGLIQSDFNLDTISLANFFPELFAQGWREVPQNEATTPKKHHYDHILYKGLKVLDSTVIKAVGTDHYPIVSTFELDV
jgi:endonuclease/exonuclease/phosphatase (EEP) superfamily protein YafD